MLEQPQPTQAYLKPCSVYPLWHPYRGEQGCTWCKRRDAFLTAALHRTVAQMTTPDPHRRKVLSDKLREHITMADQAFAILHRCFDADKD